jgi:flagellar biosynthesis chaperone FliJ
VKRIERLLSPRNKKEQSAAREVAERQDDLQKAEERVRELVERRTQPLDDVRLMEAFRMTGAWTATELEQAHDALITSHTNLDEARAALAKYRTERKVLQEHADRARKAAAVIASRVAQNAADELALTRRLHRERTEEAE